MAQQRSSVWEQQTIEKLLLEQFKERRRTRRWKNFFKLVVLALIAFIVYLNWKDGIGYGGLGITKHTAVISIDDIIMPGDTSISAERIFKSLETVYENDNVKGIILSINSPGGSPVQSDMIYNRIVELRKEHQDIPVYAVIEDIGVSGAYYIASAADEIYANPSSIVGSIGVRFDSFGFVDAIDKLGIERRLFTAGKDKGDFDPFMPLDETDETHLKSTLTDIHNQFIKSVELGRGSRLKRSEDIFSGQFWSGIKAKEMGLIDGFATRSEIAKEKIHAETMIDYSPEDDPFERFLHSIGTGVAEGLYKFVLYDSFQAN